jgi:hypothetical protein
MNIKDYLTDIILVLSPAIIVIMISKTFVYKSIYEHDTTELIKQVHTLSEANANLQYQIDHQPPLEDLKLQLKLVEDGASIEEAKLIIEQSTEAGLSPKL